MNQRFTVNIDSEQHPEQQREVNVARFGNTQYNAYSQYQPDLLLQQ